MERTEAALGPVAHYTEPGQSGFLALAAEFCFGKNRLREEL